MFGLKGKAITALAAGILLLGAGGLSAEESEAWRLLKPGLFGDREIKDGSGLLKIDGPTRAQDAGMVPIDLEALTPQGADRYIETITLVVDNNPQPVAAVFHMTPENGLASIATRIRINQYSDVRAIAETNTGELFMASRYIKASGGCSAPASKNEEQSIAQMGKMLMRQGSIKSATGGSATQDHPIVEARLHIRHPSHSGMQQSLEGNFIIPEHFLKTIEVRRGDRPVMTIEGSIALSEDPMFKFDVRAKPGDELAVTARDSNDHVFARAWPVQILTAESKSSEADPEGL